MQKKLIIFHSWLCEIGGCETVINNLCEHLKNYYDIKLLYTDGHPIQIQRFKQLVDTEKYNAAKQYECDMLIRNSAWGIEPNNIIARDNIYVQMIHSDYKMHKEKGSFTYKHWDKITHVVACGEYVAERFTEVTRLNCIPIKNILEIKKPVSKIYKFIYAGRLNDVDKNANLIRLKKFIQMLEAENIKYLLWIYTTGSVTDFQGNENIIIRKARYYDLHNEIVDVDYGLLFSDFEGLPCFVQECLQYDTPCIVTENGGCMELVKNGINGYVVPFDMEFDINIIKKIPKIKNYQNGTTADTWCNLLGGAKYEVKKRIINTQKIIALQDYYDTEEQTNIKKGDIYEVSIDRANIIIEKNLAVKGVNV